MHDGEWDRSDGEIVEPDNRGEQQRRRHEEGKTSAPPREREECNTNGERYEARNGPWSSCLCEDAVVSLERSPDVGQMLELPDGRQIIVRRVITASDGLAGTVVAGPA